MQETWAQDLLQEEMAPNPAFLPGKMTNTFTAFQFQVSGRSKDSTPAVQEYFMPLIASSKKQENTAQSKKHQLKDEWTPKVNQRRNGQLL